MAKPSHETEAALLAAGEAVIRESGFSGLSLRRVAARAGVNLGMFPYLFGTKEVFVRKVSQRIYDNFFQGFSLATSRSGRPIENLRRGLIQLGRFIRDNRRLGLSLATDVLGRHAAARGFIARNLPRHAIVIVRLVRAAQRDHSLARVPLPMALGHLMGCIAGPPLFVGLVEASGVALPARLALPFIRHAVLSDAAIERRVDLALAGLNPAAGLKVRA